jgi:tetratricopeptide (TPR) repeat protein
MIEKFIAALPAAATNPYAFIAYLVLIGTFTYISIAQFRLRTIARIIESLPEKDRRPLLQKEYNVLPASGLTAEEWIRSRRQLLIFWLLIVVIVSGLAIVVIAIKEIPAQAAAANVAKEARLVAFWQSEQTRLETLLKEGALSQESYTAILVSLNSLSAKLADPAAATVQFSIIADQISKTLGEDNYRLDPEQISQAKQALADGLPSVAIAVLKQVAANDLSNASELFYQLGLLSEQEAHFSDADGYYKQALDLKPDDLTYLDAYEATQTSLGRYDEAKRLLVREREIEESHGQLTLDRARALDLRLAYVYLVSNQFKQAESIYLSAKAAIEKEGKSATLEYAFLLNNLGSLYHNWGR